MSHLNYNHLYYFWMVQHKGSVAAAAEALYLTPQTVSGQIRLLEDRLGGKLLRRQGRGLVPTELGQLVNRYAERIFNLSYEMLDIVNYQRDSDILFEVGVADALSKSLAGRILHEAQPPGEPVHLRCYESTHDLLLDQLRQHQLDMILSDCSLDSAAQPGLFSKEIGHCQIDFYHRGFGAPKEKFPDCLDGCELLMPARTYGLGRQLLYWLDEQGFSYRVAGEFDDAGLMIGYAKSATGVFVAPASMREQVQMQMRDLTWLGTAEGLKERYYAIFAERMIQHPVVARLCELDLSSLFKPTEPSSTGSDRA